MTVNLVQAYTEYWIERAKFKAKQRVELDKHMHDKAVILGGAISEARNLGNRIEDIMVIVGRKNKTFIYEMLDIFNASRQPEIEVEPDAVTDPKIPFMWTVGEGHYRINIAGEPEYIIMFNKGGGFDLPDEWLEASVEQRARYKTILGEIHEYDKTRQE